MKQFKQFWAIVFLAILSSSLEAASVFTYDEPTGTAPIIIRTPPINPHGPRTPAFIPICAEYNSALSSILVGFLANVGDVEIVVENHSTGEVYQDVADSSNGGCAVMISGTQGFYTITFTLESGATYYGEFEIE